MTARGMKVDSPQLTDTRSMFADWIELRALASSRGTASLADIARLDAKQAENSHGLINDPEVGEELEQEILEESVSTLSNSVVDEIAFRAETLGMAYPFDLRNRSESWTLGVVLEALQRPACQVYVFCLLVSGVRDGRLVLKDINAATGEDLTRLFQGVSFLSAKLLLGGDGVSFGWPRPDGSKFLDALHVFANSFGVGEARTQPLSSSSHKEKDEGIDIIAWREFSDKRAGKLLLLGQVASGNDWTQKPVPAAVVRFLDWFVTHPAKFYIPAIFIPFLQNHQFEPLKSVAYEKAVLDYCRRQELSFGLVMDRLRIVETIAAAGEGQLNGLLDDMENWNRATLEIARSAA
jgi:hypothetical protein